VCDGQGAHSRGGGQPPPAKGALKRVAGSQIDAFNNIVIEQMVDALWKAQTSEEGREILVAAAITALAGAQPRDEMEGMLAAQMVATQTRRWSVTGAR